MTTVAVEPRAMGCPSRMRIMSPLSSLPNTAGLCWNSDVQQWFRLQKRGTPTPQETRSFHATTNRGDVEVDGLCCTPILVAVVARCAAMGAGTAQRQLCGLVCREGGC